MNNSDAFAPNSSWVGLNSTVKAMENSSDSVSSTGVHSIPTSVTLQSGSDTTVWANLTDFENDSSTANGTGHEMPLTTNSFEVPFLTAVCVVGVFGNILVLAVYLQKKYRRSNASLYVLNLALGDLLALVVVAFHVTEFFRPTWPILWNIDILCIIHRFMRYVGFNITVFTMVAIAIDRYFAICHPMKFRVSFTLTRTKVILVILWVLALAASSPTLFMFKTIYGSMNHGDTYEGKSAFACKLVLPYGKKSWFRHFKAFYFNLVLFYIPSILTLVLYIVIVVEVWKSTRGMLGQVKGNDGKDQKTSKFDKAHWKTARTLMIVFFAYFMCYVLLCTYNLMFIYLPENAMHPMAKNVGLLIPYANSCMNPIIYSFCNPQFRKACRRLFSKRKSETAVTSAYTMGSAYDNSEMDDTKLENAHSMNDMSQQNPIDIKDE
ncbi:C-C chemokine receptor type 1-like [Glandiceps talaboti]